jgi:carbamate kinase
MRIVVALGGNALLRHGEPMTSQAQHTNVRIAAQALADLAREHQIIVAHGSGPQVGLMALQAAAFAPQSPWPMDILGSETEGMIGYLIEQELMNALSTGSECATFLTRVEVDRNDPAFLSPTKAIGPVYSAAEAKAVRVDHDWPMISTESGGLRRIVPAPLPIRVLGVRAIRLLVDAGICVMCAGGGGIPLVRRADGGMEGVEAVIDKDCTAALLATALQADALLMLTDVDAIYAHWGTPEQKGINQITPDAIEAMSFDVRNMGPKVASACTFVRSGGLLAGVGRLADARAILQGSRGTRIALPSIVSQGTARIEKNTAEQKEVSL